MKYNFDVKAIFSGNVIIEAENEEEARKILNEDWGVVLTGGSTTNDEQVVDWNMNLHPDEYQITLKGK